MSLILDLFLTFLKIGLFSIGGGICDTALDSAAGRCCPSMADTAGIYRHHHALADDARTAGRQHLDVCRDALSRDGGSRCGNRRLRPVRNCNQFSFAALFPPQSKSAGSAAVVGNAKIRFRRADRRFRRHDHHDRVVRRFLLETNAAFQPFCFSALPAGPDQHSKMETRPHADLNSQRIGRLFFLPVIHFLAQLKS